MGTINRALLYHLRTRRITSDLDAIAKLTRDSERLLEVGSGTGRIISHLAKTKNAHVVGLESDSLMHEVALSNCASHKNIELINISFCDFKTGSKYDCILFAFNVLTEFTDVQSRFQALRKARELLSPEGRIIVIYSLSDFADMARKNVRYSFNIEDLEFGKWKCTITCTRDFLSQISHCHVKYSQLGGGQLEVLDDYSSALLTRNELLALYLANGLTVTEEYGDYGLGPLNDSSTVNIHVLEP